MKKLLMLLGLSILILTVTPIVSIAQNLLNQPESVVYDSIGNRYLVSNFGDGAIVQIDSNGVQSYFNNDLMGSHQAVGLHIKDNFLFAAMNAGFYMGVCVFDLTTGNMDTSIYMPAAMLLNDIASDTSGNIYVSDFESHRLYKVRLSDYHVSTFVSTGLPVANGVLFDAHNNRLLVISNDTPKSILYSVNLFDSTLTMITELVAPGDGLAEDDERNVYFSAWSTDRIYRYDPDFSGPYEVVAEGFTDPADIFFNKKRSELVVPNFNANRVDLVQVDVGLFTRLCDIDPVVSGGASQGVTWTDYTNDGFSDLYFSNSMTPDGQVNFLYENISGTGFAGISSGEIVVDIGLSSTSTWGDCDNDGDLDVFVANGPDQANSLYYNNGDGSFSPLTEGEIVTELLGSPAASWVDFDNDGFLDLFVANTGANSLYKNSGSGFVSVTGNAVTQGSEDSYGACWGDYNNDGLADLFVARTDNSHNQLFENEGNGVFQSVESQIIVNDGGESYGGSWGDYDNDGDLDLFVPNAANTSDGNNFLYNNQGDGTFTKITSGAIITDGGNSRGSGWGDYDNDGDLDLYVTNTSGVDFLYQNNGDGTFARVSDCEIADEIEVSFGAAWGDFDHDGDLDLAVARANGSSEADNALYKNNAKGNNWLYVKCAGQVSNSSAIGAKVRIKAIIDGLSIWQMREISAQTGYGGQNDLNVHFGLGDATLVDSLIVEWPSGLIQTFTDIDVNQFLAIADYVCGDANSDEAINVGDAVHLINYVFKQGPAPNPLESGDPNCDESVNVGDAVYIINYVFKQGLAPCATCP